MSRRERSFWRLYLFLCCVIAPLQGQTLRDVTVRDVVLGTASGGSNESVPVTDNVTGGLSTPAGSGYWRCVALGDIAGDCESEVNDDSGGTPESWGSYDDDNACNDETVSPTTEELRVDFDSPSSNPTATSNAQVIRIVFDKTNASCVESDTQNDPTVDISVYDGSSLVPLVTNLDCYGTDGVDEPYTYPWTYNGASDGSEVYLEVFDDGNGQLTTNRRRCGIEYVEWYAEVN